MNISKNDLKSLMGTNLRRLRTARSLSIDELANMMKITPGFLGLIERGRRGLTAYMLMTAARIFNVSFNYFFDGGEQLETEDDDGLTTAYNSVEDGVVIFMPVIVYPQKYMDELQGKIRKIKKRLVFSKERKLELLTALLSELEG